MPHFYSEEPRQAVVTKLLPHNPSPQVIEGISLATVYKWHKEARAEGRCLPGALGKGADEVIQEQVQRGA